jgi:hypothetical protein
VNEVNEWRRRRNGALHELVKVQASVKNKPWDERNEELRESAVDGYELLKHVYYRVADLNPSHEDRVFARPIERTSD